MYLVEGRNAHETRGQYVLSKEAAYAIFEEMKLDFLKVNIYEKENGEYKRIEKYEREQTEREWLNSLSDEEFAEWIENVIVFADKYRPYSKVDVGWLDLKQAWMKWLKQPHATE